MEKIEKKQTKDRIAGILRMEILAGTIKEGDELTQEGLAETLGVSRMPVREALQILEQEGLLLRLPNRHMKVTPMGKQELEETFQLIAVVEAQIFQMLKNRNASIDGLKLLTEKDTEFRTTLAEQVENGYIRQIYCRMLAGYPACIREQEDNREKGIKYNEAILAAYCQNNMEELSQHVSNYYRWMMEEMINKYRR